MKRRGMLRWATVLIVTTISTVALAQTWGGPMLGYSYPTSGPSTQQQTNPGVQEFNYYAPAYNPRMIYGSQTNAGGKYYWFNPSLLLQSQTLGGGRNNGPGVGDKTTDGTLYLNHYKYTPGQTYQTATFANCFAAGDCIGQFSDVVSWGGPSTAGDEGSKALRLNVFEQGTVFTGTATAITVAIDKTVVTTSQQTNQGVQGPGTMLVDLSRGESCRGTPGQYQGDTIVTLSGCNPPGNSVRAVLTADVTSGNVLPVSSTQGFVVGQLVGVFDHDWECETATAVGATTVTVANRLVPHYLGAWVTQGGAVCKGVEFEADRNTPGAMQGISEPVDSNHNSVVRFVIPVMASSGNVLTLTNGYNQMPGHTAGYPGRAPNTPSLVDVYPACKVVSVYNPVVGKVDGSFTTEPCAGQFAVGDKIEDEHGYLQRNSGVSIGFGQYTPSMSSEPRVGLELTGGGVIANTDVFVVEQSGGTNPGVYKGFPGGSGNLIAPRGNYVEGAVSTSTWMHVPPFGPGMYGYLGSGVVMVDCGDIGCAAWNQTYPLFALLNTRGGRDILGYNPSTETWTITSGATGMSGQNPVCTLSFGTKGLTNSCN